jgi:hypothetical protein
MKVNGRFLRLFTVLLVLNVSIFLSCTSTIESETVDTSAPTTIEMTSDETEELPPLVVDTNAPLLLDEPTEGDGSTLASNEVAIENTACFVCHANYMTESLASRHTGVNIGCIHCHGQSTAHRNDENNTTPPEIMYPREKVDPFCQGCHITAHDISPKTIITRWLQHSEEEIHPSCTGCHKEDDVPPAKVVARWKEKGLDKAKTDPEKTGCTDCHGEHQIRVRTIVWDKKTGKLLRTNRGE